ncbi:TPA: sugar ABC transporter substrate-binding protein [Candidatus Sumerlaeota bacterium]|jgi:ribose transport system substrate-binding protein|nr:sugar ABC transporter substrate-binding protein [Candidatus Sumerlaeota bacterium]
MNSFLKPIVLFSVLFCVLSNACAADEKIPKDAPKKLKIAMIAKSSTNLSFLLARRGAEDTARDLSKKYKMEITIDWRTPPTEDGQVQAERITQSVNDGADAVMISCSDAAKVIGAIDQAVERGIPVMTFDSDAPESKRFAFYGADDAEAGQMVMAETIKAVNGKGNIAILGGNPHAPNLQRRIAAAKIEAAKHSGIKIVDVFYCMQTPQDASAEVIRANNANPEITAWCMPGGWALFTPALLTHIDPTKMKIVSGDGLPPQLIYLEKGIATTLVAQPSYQWGSLPVQMIVDKIVFKKKIPVINKMELVKVDKSNLGSWARQLVKWGYTNEIPEEYVKMP